MFRGERGLLRLRRLIVATWLVGHGLALAAGADESDRGRLGGRVLYQDGAPAAGVRVEVSGLGRTAETDDTGAFAIGRLPAGSYTLIFSLGRQTASHPDVQVEAGRTTEIEKRVDWQYVFAERLTVFSPGRRRQRIVDSPAAVSVVTRERIAREASTGQLPKLLESVPGAEITQSGLYDFKLNVRGANTSVNRRVAVLIDGRDPSFPFLGAQEWAAISFPLDDLVSAELIRGPSSALYGANAFNGVLNLTTSSPAQSPGAMVRVTGGELSTARLDLRLAGPLGSDTHYKLLGGYSRSDDFAVSRNESLEYAQPCTLVLTTECMVIEAVPLPSDKTEIGYLSGRIDRDFGSGRSLAVELGTADIDGYVFIAPGSRFQLTELKRPWARLNLNSPRWNLLATYTGRDAEALTMVVGAPSFLDSYRGGVELQGNWEIGQGRGRVVTGASLGRESVDTAGPDGVQTLIDRARDDEQWALFGQLDYDLGERLKLVLAGRMDDSSFHDAEFSPRGALVWEVAPSRTLRLSYAEGFQRPNYPEYFVRGPLGAPLDLSVFEGFCAPVGVSCGFDRPVQLAAIGNANLRVEKIRNAEIGYSAVLGRSSFLTVDAYYSEIEDFVQQFVPLVGTRAGRANPDFGPYAPPAELPEPFRTLLLGTLQQALPPFLFPFLSNFPENGDPVFALRTSINFGEVEVRGLEVAIDHQIGDGWSFDGNYSYLDFTVRDQLEEAPLAPNGPEHKLNLGLGYVGEKLAGSLRYRWFDEFLWAEGVLIGTVPSYGVVNLVSSYQISDAVEVGINVSNLLDNRHHEVFSGDVLGRLALVHLRYSR